MTPPVPLPPLTVSDAQVQLAVASDKYNLSPSDTPQTIAVIPQEVYQAQGAASLADVLKNTPGITLFAGEGGGADRTGGDSFYLRGYDTSNSVFVDGVRDEGAVVHDTFNLSQVEVFKGPAADNGRGGTAGYVNLVTKLPEAKPLHDLEITHGFGADGSRSSDRATLDVNEPWGAAALRLNLMDQSGGVAGRKEAQNNRWGVAPSLALGLGTPNRAWVVYEHQTERNLPDYGLPDTVTPSLAANYYGFADFDSERVTQDAATLRLEHDFAGGARLANQSRWEVTERIVEATYPNATATAPVGEASLVHGISQTANRIASNQTSLTDRVVTGPLTQEVSTGVELSRETSDSPAWATVRPGSPTPNYLVDLNAPDSFPGALFAYDPHPTGAGTWTRIDTGAAYAFDTLKVGARWDVTGGVRLERYDLRETARTVGLAAIPAYAGAAGGGGVPPTAATSAVAGTNAGESVLTSAHGSAAWKAGVVFHPVVAGSLYVSYATSIRPPGSAASTNALSTTASSADNPLLAPEVAENDEAGAKWNFCGDRLLATAAGFRSVNRHVPATDPVSGAVDQASDQTVNGVELGLTGHLSDRWLVYAGYAAMHATVAREISTNAQGLTLPLLPRQSGNVWMTYALPHRVTVGGGAQYVGETERLQAPPGAPATTVLNAVPGYWVGSALVSWQMDRHLTLRLNVSNLADRRYISSLNNNGARLTFGAPRSALLALEIK